MSTKHEKALDLLVDATLTPIPADRLDHNQALSIFFAWKVMERRLQRSARALRLFLTIYGLVVQLSFYVAVGYAAWHFDSWFLILLVMWAPTISIKLDPLPND